MIQTPFLRLKHNHESLEETMALWRSLLSWKFLNPLHHLSPGLNNKDRSNTGYHEFVSLDSIKIPWDKTREGLESGRKSCLVTTSKNPWACVPYLLSSNGSLLGVQEFLHGILENEGMAWRKRQNENMNRLSFNLRWLYLPSIF